MLVNYSSYSLAVSRITSNSKILDESILRDTLALKKININNKISYIVSQQESFANIEDKISNAASEIKEYKLNQFNWIRSEYLSNILGKISVAISSYFSFGLINKASKEIQSIQKHRIHLNEEFNKTNDEILLRLQKAKENSLKSSKKADSFLSNAKNSVDRSSKAVEKTRVACVIANAHKAAKNAENFSKAAAQSVEKASTAAASVEKTAIKAQEMAFNAIAARVEAEKSAMEVSTINKNFSVKIINAKDYNNPEEAIKIVEKIADETGEVCDSEDYIREFYFPNTTYHKNDKLRAYLAINNENKIVGFSICEAERDKFHIHRIAVQGNFRGDKKEAVGTRLMFASLENAKLEGYKKADLDYDAAYSSNPNHYRLILKRWHFYNRFSEVFKIETSERSYYHGEVTIKTFDLNTFKYVDVLRILFEKIFPKKA